MAQGVSGNMRFLVRFQDGCDKDLTSNHLIIMTIDRILWPNNPRFPQFMWYLMRHLIWIRDNIMIYSFFCSLIMRGVLIGTRTRQTCRKIQIRRIWRMWDSKMKESVTGGWFSRITMDGWMIKNQFYMLGGGIYKLKIKYN